MLPTHGRYLYSNITKRPDYTWPNGRRLAVYVALNIEAFSFGMGKGAAIAPPDQAHSHSVYSWRDYGNRVGMWRLFELFDRLEFPIEAQMNTAIYDLAPDIPEKLRARGDEILGHGETNSEEQGGLRETEERAMIERVTATLESHEGQRPTGWMTGAAQSTRETMHAPVYGDNRACDVAGKRRGEKGDEMANVLRLAEVSGGDMGVDKALPAFFGGIQAFQNLFAVDATGRDAVNGDPLACQVA